MTVSNRSFAHSWDAESLGPDPSIVQRKVTQKHLKKIDGFVKVKNKNYSFGLWRNLILTSVLLAPAIVLHYIEYSTSISPIQSIEDLMIDFITTADLTRTLMLLK